MRISLCGAFFAITANGGNIRSGGFRSSSYSTEAEITIKLLRLETHNFFHDPEASGE
jgi:hypothetical protein